MGTPFAESSHKRSRLVTGCARCRDRHLKCDTNSRCQQCSAAGTDCDRARKLRFRHEVGAASTPNCGFPSNQRWLSVDGPLRYHNETSEIVRYYEKVLSEDTLAPGSFINITRDHELGYGSSVTNQHHQGGFFEHRAFIQPTTAPDAATNVQVDTSQSLTPYAPMPLPLSNVLSTSEDSPSSLLSRPSYITHLAHQLDQFEPFTDREASLMRNFTEHVALWLDVVDQARSFEIEVPRRALYNIMLRYAIFGFSSRHLNRHAGDTDLTEALDYRNKALQLLIPQLSGPVEGLTEEHLASIIILRIDEEMETDDTQSHLAGATEILNSIASFGSFGGLGEACAWVCLRQDIYVSVATQTPLRMKWSNLYDSSWIQKDDDVSWASRIVLLLAEILTLAFVERSNDRASQLRCLSDKVDDWDRSKPSSFRPIKTVRRSKGKDSRLPVIWMLSPCHVFGVQFYHIARIILLLSLDQEKNQNTGFQDYHSSRKVEKLLREQLLIVVGLATSNPKVENTLFQARHALAVWGGVLRHPLDQEAAAQFLHLVQDRTGWNMSKALDSLRKLWHEDSD